MYTKKGFQRSQDSSCLLGGIRKEEEYARRDLETVVSWAIGEIHMGSYQEWQGEHNENAGATNTHD